MHTDMYTYLKLTVLVLSAASAAGLLFEWTSVVEIAQGKLRGISEETHNKYLGIPYAKVEKRYQVASGSPPWKDIYFAVEDRHCRQLFPVLKFPYGTEDCLILNVYTPKYATLEQPLPVMVFIHGGGFNFGGTSSLFYDPAPLVEKGVVVVTITYRLGAQGFLCLGLREAPGNVGLKDQVMALRWVRENIKAFGGDPNSVTIFGESAGATCVHLLILSKMARGLFHRAILESNSALTSITFSYDPVRKASEVAERLGYNTKDPKQLLSIFRRVNITDIIVATDASALMGKFNFVPCVEKQFPGMEPFLTETPHDILSKGAYIKVPMIIGHNEKEGTVFVGMLTEADYERYSKHFEKWLPPDINFKSPTEKIATAKVIREFYFGNKSYIKNRTEEVIQLVTDAFFHFSNVYSSEIHVNNSDTPLYNYFYTYDSERNIGRAFSQLPQIPGATHFDEMFYIFNPSIRVSPLRGRDLVMANRMSTLWTNFAKTSNPTPSSTRLIPNIWTPSDSGGLRFYKIDDEMCMMNLPNVDRMNLWRKIYNKFGYRKAILKNYN